MSLYRRSLAIILDFLSATYNTNLHYPDLYPRTWQGRPLARVVLPIWGTALPEYCFQEPYVCRRLQKGLEGLIYVFPALLGKVTNVPIVLFAPIFRVSILLSRFLGDKQMMRAKIRIVSLLHPDNNNEFDDESLDQPPSDWMQSKQALWSIRSAETLAYKYYI